jgi:biotin carboxylase
MKKLLLLGAMQMHVPIIRRAKERGIYVITCDYIPENVGHKLADKAYFDSTTDLSTVLQIAQEEQVDGIMTFNSDPAALTAAYVADKLNLPGSGYEAVKIMSEKDLFRTFLKEHEFNVPQFKQYTDVDTLLSDIDQFRFPVMLKPVDSSGSKGVVRIDSPLQIADSFTKALEYSRCKRVIVEEFITPRGAQMHGDAFVKDGKVEFIYLGDHHFDPSINNLVPVSTTFPSLHSNEDIHRVEDEVQRFITAVGFRQGGINIEARISVSDQKVYLIEVGPRNGGNFTPIVIQYASGFNFMDACLEVALGLPFTPQYPKKEGCYAYLILHSREDGILSGIKISSSLEEKVLQRYDYLRPGDPVKSFRGANAAVGVLLARFSSQQEMQQYADHIEKYSTVKLK